MFNTRLNECRKNKGYTAQKMADLLEMSLRSYQFYESGGRAPSLSTLVQIADILDVSIDWLLCRDEWLSKH